MFYGVKEEDAVKYALMVADCKGMTDKQKLRIEKRMRQLMNQEN